jgi:short-subunit dehydrogenase
VVISSLLGKIAAPARSAYCASKHALHGFFDALRAEVHRHGVFVTIICPGFVRTNASMNALTGEGQPHGKMDELIAGGLASGVCARQIVKAIERHRREVYIGQKEVLSVYLIRWAPNLFHRFLRNTTLK